MIALDHLGAFAPFLLQLERRLEEVHVKPCRRVEPAHHARRLDAVEPAISHKSANDCAVLLLDEGLVSIQSLFNLSLERFPFGLNREDS
jgi:hypothetical protein